MKVNKLRNAFLLNFFGCFLIKPSTGGICGENQALIEIEIHTERFVDETFWTLNTKGNEHNIFLQNETILSGTKNYAHYTCQDKNECFTFTITESCNTGICCPFGKVSYLIFLNGQKIASGKESGCSESVTFGQGCGNGDKMNNIITTSNPSNLPQTSIVEYNFNTSALPSLYPTIKPIVMKEDIENETKEKVTKEDDKKVGPVTIENLQINLYGLKKILNGQEMTVFEQRMKSYIEQFYNGNKTSALTIQNKVSNVKSRIVVFSQELSLDKDGKSRNLSVESRPNTRRASSSSSDVRLVIRYNQELSYVDMSSTELNVVLEAPFSTSTRRYEFVNFLKMNSNEVGGLAFTDLNFIDMPFVFESKDDESGDSKESKVTNKSSLGVIIGFSLAGVSFCILVQVVIYSVRQNQKYGKSKEKYEWPFNDARLPNQRDDLNIICEQRNDLQQTQQRSTTQNETHLKKTSQIKQHETVNHSCPSIFSFDSSFEEIYNKETMRNVTEKNDEKYENRRKPVLDIVGAAPTNHFPSKNKLPTSFVEVENSECSTLTYDTPLRNGPPSTVVVKVYNTQQKGNGGPHSFNGLNSHSSSTFSSNTIPDQLNHENNNISKDVARQETVEQINRIPSFTKNENKNSTFENEPNLLPNNNRMIICAPPGKLGIILDSTDGHGPKIRCLKEGSCMENDLQKGDRIVMIDQEDVCSYDNIEVSKLLAKKSSKPIQLVVMRRSHRMEQI